MTGNMRTYVSHKEVQAGRIDGYYQKAETFTLNVEGFDFHIKRETFDRMTKMAREHDLLKTNSAVVGPAELEVPDTASAWGIIGGYVVKYPDGYISWSPKEAFEEGYSEKESLEAQSGAPETIFVLATDARMVDQLDGNRAEQCIVAKRPLRNVDGDEITVCYVRRIEA